MSLPASSDASNGEVRASAKHVRLVTSTKREGPWERERGEAFPLPFVLCARSCPSKTRETSGNEAASFSTVFFATAIVIVVATATTIAIFSATVLFIIHSLTYLISFFNFPLQFFFWGNQGKKDTTVVEYMEFIGSPVSWKNNFEFVRIVCS